MAGEDYVFKLGLEDGDFRAALQRMQSSIKGLTQEWKENERAYKQVNDLQEAQKAKVNGLLTVLEKQQALLAKLRSEEEKLGKRTKENASDYDYLQKQLGLVGAQVTKTNAAYNAQKGVLDKLTLAEKEQNKALAESRAKNQELAESYEFGKKSLDRLNESVKLNDTITKGNVDVAKSMKNETKALVFEQEGLTKSISRQQEIRKIEITRLERIKALMTASKADIQKQEAEVAKANSTLAKYNDSLKRVQSQINKSNPYGLSKWTTGLNQVYRASEKLEGKMGHLFSSIKSGAITASIGLGALGGIAIDGAKKAGDLQSEYLKNYNLLVTGGEKAAEAQHAVNEMQKNGEQYSIKYGVSQQKIADGYQELIKRGYTSAQALGSMEAMLQTSVATGDDFNNVVANSSATLESFGLKVDDTSGMIKNSHDVVNQMAYAADLTATDFQSMGKAMEYAGASAHISKISLGETASAIGILSNNGLAAEKAGTGLRQVMQRLQKTTLPARDALQELGLTTDDLIDKEGNMKSLTDVFGLLNEHMKGLGNADKARIFTTLFGVTGQQAAIILSQNVDQLDQLNKKVKESADSGDYVKTLAEKNTETVNNQLKKFSAAIDQISIQIGAKMLPVITEAAQATVKFFNSKDGQKFVQGIADAVSGLFDNIKNMIIYMSQNQGKIKAFATAIAGIWAVNKIGKVIGSVKELMGLLKTMAGINALQSITGSGVVGKVNKTTTAVEATEAAMTLGSGSKGGGSGTAGGYATRTARLEAEQLASKGGKLAGAAGRFGSILGGVAGIGSLIGAGAELTHGSVGGRIGGATGVLGGAAIGSVIPGAGTAVGGLVGAGLGIAGSFAGGKAGRVLGNAIEKTGPVQDIVQKIKLQYDKKEFSKEQKDFRKEYDKSVDKINEKSHIKVGFDSMATSKAKKQSENLFDGLSKDVLNYYAKKTKNRDKDLQLLVKNGVLTQKEADKANEKALAADSKKESSTQKTLNTMRDENDKYWKKVEKIQKGGTSTLQQLEKDGGKKSKAYKEELNYELQEAQKSHNKKMEKLEQQLNNKITDETKIASGKQTDILATLKDKKIKLSEQELKQLVKNSQKETNTIVKNANTTYKKAVSAANKKYKETTNAADQEYYVNKSISKKQYDAIINNAEKQRKDAVKKAKDQKDKVVEHTQNQNKKVQKAVEDQRKAVVKKAQDQLTGSTKAASDQKKAVEKLFGQQKTDVLNIVDAQKKAHKKAVGKESKEIVQVWSDHNSKVAKKFDKNSSDINKVLNGMNKGSGNIPLIGGYAKGTKGLAKDETALVGEEGFELAYNSSKGLHVLGKNGPEITNLTAGTSILPHNLSEKFLQTVKAMPAHKDGVGGTIDKLFSLVKKGGNWLEDSAEDVMDFVKKGAKSVFDMIAKSTGLDKVTKEDYNVGAFQTYSQESTDKGSTGVQDVMKKVFDTFKKKYEEEGGGGRGAPKGAGVQRWKGQVKAALKANGLSTSTAMVNKVLRQIATESGGNEKAVQGGYTDINTITGDLAKGLMQTISATFNAYKFPGHGNIFNGYDNLLAALNYAKHRYGSNLSYLGQGHGYEHGGIITSHQLAELGENGKKEVVIPLDISERSRALPLMRTAINEMSNQQQKQSSNDISLDSLNGTDLSEVVEKMNEILAGLGAIVNAVNTSLTPQKVTNAVNMQTRRNSSLQAQMKGI